MLKKVQNLIKASLYTSQLQIKKLRKTALLQMKIISLILCSQNISIHFQINSEFLNSPELLTENTLPCRKLPHSGFTASGGPS